MQLKKALGANTPSIGKKAYPFIMGNGRKRNLAPGLERLVKGMALVTTLFNIWAAVAHPVALLHRSISLGLFFALIFILYTMPGTRQERGVPWYDWLLAALSLAVSVYVVADLDRFVTRLFYVDKVFTGDLIFGLLTVCLLLEGTRRVSGPWLSILCILSVGYALWGGHIPGLFGHKGFTPTQITEELFLTLHGIWGSALGMAVTYIILFIIFGAFLKHSGAGDSFFEIASAIAGKTRGGQAKVALIASGMFGMISGSPSANVATTGAITIPMMKKSGFPPAFAAAVESCASNGGIIMPPIMGSVAFLMAEILGCSYVTILTAAFIPAVFYYAALFLVVDFRAGSLGINSYATEQTLPLKTLLFKGAVFFIPLGYLVVLLLRGSTPTRAALEVILLVFALSWLRRDTRMTWRKTLRALTEGTTQGILVIATMAAAGIFLGMINLTGLGAKFSSFLMAMSGQAVLSTLVFTMLLAILLGLAMNIAPSYLLAAVIAGPALVNLGISPLAAHMFIFFYAALAPITPPVALICFTAAGIAGADPMRVTFLSMRLVLVAYLIPFVFVFQPALLLQDSAGSIAFAFSSGMLSMVFVAMGCEGWFGRELGRAERVLLVTAGILALTGYWYCVGAALILGFLSPGVRASVGHRLRMVGAFSMMKQRS